MERLINNAGKDKEIKRDFDRCFIKRHYTFL